MIGGKIAFLGIELNLKEKGEASFHIDIDIDIDQCWIATPLQGLNVTGVYLALAKGLEVGGPRVSQNQQSKQNGEFEFSALKPDFIYYWQSNT